LFYGRFLLHAIDESAQNSLIGFTASELSPGDFLALEYRVAELERGQYVYGDHYRRPVDPLTVEQQCRSTGFQSVKTEVSKDFAVLEEERPLIARTLAVF
jgi:hypothetical protein